MAKKIHVVAAVVEHSDGRILCAKRGNAKNPCVAWKWEFPGGKVESEEAPQEALARELLEEMDLRVNVIRKITTVTHTYPDCEIEMDAFYCVPTEFNATFSLREHIEAGWLYPDELDSLEWADADKPIVEHVKNAGGLQRNTHKENLRQKS